MELHHKLRRDPNWHPNACNICGQLGHQAAACPNGTINWREIYGNDAFVIRPAIYPSEIYEWEKKKAVDFIDLERRAKEYASVRLDGTVPFAQPVPQRRAAPPVAAQAPAGAAPVAAAAPVNAGGAAPAAAAAAAAPAPAPAAEKKPEDDLPEGWAVAYAPNTGRPYYWHKKTQKTVWQKPTADTPIQ